MKKLQATLVCLVAFSGIPLSAQSVPYPFNDPDLPVEKRIDNLLSLMTIDEKVACLGTNTRVQRLGVTSAARKVFMAWYSATHEARNSRSRPRNSRNRPAWAKVGTQTWSVRPRLLRDTKPVSSPRRPNTGGNSWSSGDRRPTSLATRAGAAAKRCMAKIRSSTGPWQVRLSKDFKIGRAHV